MWPGSRPRQGIVSRLRLHLAMRLGRPGRWRAGAVPGGRRHGWRGPGAGGSRLTFFQKRKVLDVCQRRRPLTWPSRGPNEGIGAPEVRRHPGLYRRAVQGSGQAGGKRGRGRTGNTTGLSYHQVRGLGEGASGCGGCWNRGREVEWGGGDGGIDGGSQAASLYGW